MLVALPKLLILGSANQYRCMISHLVRVQQGLPCMVSAAMWPCQSIASPSCALSSRNELQA